MATKYAVEWLDTAVTWAFATKSWWVRLWRKVFPSRYMTHFVITHSMEDWQ